MKNESKGRSHLFVCCLCVCLCACCVWQLCLCVPHIVSSGKRKRAARSNKRQQQAGRVNEKPRSRPCCGQEPRLLPVALPCLRAGPRAARSRFPLPLSPVNRLSFIHAFVTKHLSLITYHQVKSTFCYLLHLSLIISHIKYLKKYCRHITHHASCHMPHATSRRNSKARLLGALGGRGNWGLGILLFCSPGFCGVGCLLCGVPSSVQLNYSRPRR